LFFGNRKAKLKQMSDLKSSKIMIEVVKFWYEFKTIT